MYKDGKFTPFSDKVFKKIDRGSNDGVYSYDEVYKAFGNSLKYTEPEIRGLFDYLIDDGAMNKILGEDKDKIFKQLMTNINMERRKSHTVVWQFMEPLIAKYTTDG